MITIIDYDMGNVGSIKNMLEYLGFYNVKISCDKDTILQSTHVILPGVGSFDEGMRNLESRGLDLVLKEYALILKRPLLGICLGMQLLGRASEEGVKQGLGLIDFYNIRFRLNHDFKVPHMGWNSIVINKQNNPLTLNLDNNSRFYFVHSYHAVCDNKNHIILTTNYGYEVIAGINEGSIFGVQFHPEKSHQFGMTLLQNFMRI